MPLPGYRGFESLPLRIFAFLYRIPRSLALKIIILVLMKELDTSYIKDWPQEVVLGEADIAEQLSPDHLSDAERKEYYSFKNDRRKAEYLSARKLFRFLLSNMDMNENEVQLLKEEEGKPYAVCRGKHLYLSFSHSSLKVYCVISKNLDVGLDVEPAERNISKRVLERITSQAERSIIASLEPGQIWTIKEAVVKFLGTGLRTNLNELTIVKNENSQISVRFNNDKFIEICSFKQSDHQIALAYQSKHI